MGRTMGGARAVLPLCGLGLLILLLPGLAGNTSLSLVSFSMGIAPATAALLSPTPPFLHTSSSPLFLLPTTHSFSSPPSSLLFCGISLLRWFWLWRGGGPGAVDEAGQTLQPLQQGRLSLIGGPGLLQAPPLTEPAPQLVQSAATPLG